jgi:NAD-dependent dihydropyrimidine dehydrogenase PreA subunit
MGAAATTGAAADTTDEQDTEDAAMRAASEVTGPTAEDFTGPAGSTAAAAGSTVEEAAGSTVAVAAAAGSTVAVAMAEVDIGNRLWRWFKNANVDAAGSERCQPFCLASLLISC